MIPSPNRDFLKMNYDKLFGENLLDDDTVLKPISRVNENPALNILKMKTNFSVIGILRQNIPELCKSCGNEIVICLIIYIENECKRNW